MPVVLRVNGFKFFFYQADVANEPPHVHVAKDGNEAKFWLDPIRIAREGRFRKSDLRDIERIIRENLEFLLSAWKKGVNMSTVKAKIPAHAEYEPVLPLAVPDLNEVKAFASHLHALGAYWRGEIFGWQAEYTPESDKKPLDSNMTFTPADFWIGESGIWFFSLMWEHGGDKEPVEFLDDRGIVK